MRALLLAGSALLLVYAPSIRGDEERGEKPQFQPAKPEKDDSDLRRLQKDRYNNAVDLLDQELLRVGAGADGIAIKVGQALDRIVLAGLELDPGPKERVALLEEAIRVSKLVEQTLSEGHQVGKVPMVEVLRARAYRLDAEIRLQREKERGKR